MSSSPVAVVIGASRGIGRQIALTLAQNNYTVVVAAKSSSISPPKSFPPDPNSADSTINTVAREIQEAGGKAYARQVDVRDFENITSLVDETVRRLGRI